MEQDKDFSAFVSDIKALLDVSKGIFDQAVDIYTPIVNEYCLREYPEEAVDNLFSELLDFAEDERLLALFKQLARRYLLVYPNVVYDYIRMYFEFYEPEKLEQL